MPQMANITVKKADGTTDIVYNALSPSAGDNVPARWRSTLASAIPAHRPTFSLLSRPSNSRNQDRVFSGLFRMPVVAMVNGVATVVATIPVDFKTTLAQNVDALIVKEAVYQGGNLFCSALVRTSMEEGYSPT